MFMFLKAQLITVRVHYYEHLIPVTDSMHCLYRGDQKDRLASTICQLRPNESDGRTTKKYQESLLPKDKLFHGHLHFLVPLMEISHVKPRQLLNIRNSFWTNSKVFASLFVTASLISQPGLLHPEGRFWSITFTSCSNGHAANCHDLISQTSPAEILSETDNT